LLLSGELKGWLGSAEIEQGGNFRLISATYENMSVIVNINLGVLPHLHACGVTFVLSFSTI
jgi:hypothetical protein